MIFGREEKKFGGWMDAMQTPQILRIKKDADTIIRALSGECGAFSRVSAKRSIDYSFFPVKSSYPCKYLSMVFCTISSGSVQS